MLDTGWLSWLEYKRVQENEVKGNEPLSEIPEPKKELPRLDVLHHYTILRSGRLQSLEINHSRDLCVFGDSLNGATLYNARNKETSYFHSFPGQIFDVTFFRDDVILGISDQGLLCTHSINPTDEWQKVYQTSNQTPINCISYNPTSHHLIAGDESGTIYFVPNGNWDKIKIESTTHKSEIGCSAISPDGKLGIFGSYEGVLSLWNLENWTRIKSIPLAKNAIRDGVVGEKELLILSDDSYTLFDYPSLEKKWDILAENFTYPLADISPDQKHALVSLSKKLFLYDLKDGSEIAKYNSRAFLCVARFLYDNTIVALSGQKEFIILSTSDVIN